MRDAGDICYADVFRDGTGVVEYTNHEDMKYALRKLDDTKFKSHEVIFHTFDLVHLQNFGGQEVFEVVILCGVKYFSG